MRSEKGIALVLTLFLMMALSAAAASLMFLSQTETYSSANYRLMSQARYGAESGIQSAANYLMNSYTPPDTGGADPLTNYNTNASPVTFNGQPVVLSGNSTVPSNYPIAAVQTAFSNAVKGNLTTGNTTVAYAPSATLLSMKQIDIYGGNKATIQTWQITSDGSIKAARTAQVEVTAILETPPVPLMPYAAFATSGDCAAMDFKGNTTRTDSYDSTQLVGGNPNVASSGGNVGTNGNLTEAGGATINGSLSTPRVGIGNCSSGNVNALSSSGGATVIGGVAQLPQSVKEPDLPAFPNPPTGPINENGQTLGNGDSVGDVTVTAGATLTLCSNNQTCTITVNSIKLSGNSTLKIAPGATVILRVAGQSSSTPIDFTGGSVVASFSPDHFQIQYAGTGTIKVNGGANTAELIYAPNGAVQFNGGGDFYGAVIAATVTDMGGAKIHYDRHLSTLFFAAGNTMLSSFSWNKY